MTEQELQAVDSIRALIGEHFHNFTFVVLTDNGDMYYDYQNSFIGESLLRASLDAVVTEESIEFIDPEGEEEYG